MAGEIIHQFVQVDPNGEVLLRVSRCERCGGVFLQFAEGGGLDEAYRVCLNPRTAALYALAIEAIIKVGPFAEDDSDGPVIETGDGMVV
jgi:hypothetical protein